MLFDITPQHSKIFGWVKRPTSRSLVISAVAGAGKSRTLIEILRLLPRGDRATFVAFNRTAATEIGEKAARAGLARPGIDFRTLNSLGMRGIVGAYGRDVRVSESSTKERIRRRLLPNEWKETAPVVEKLVAAAKSQGLVPDGVGATRRLLADEPASWAALAEQFDIELGDRALTVARAVLVEGLQDRTSIDFDDQLYMTFAFCLPLPRVDWLLVDEAQDLNPVQRAMLRQALRPGGHIIAVGDERQSINGWRGADVDSLGAIGRVYGAITLPLSTTYRCPRAHVELCQQWVPHFSAAPTAKEGTITHVEGDDVDAIEWRSTDLVVCRVNAPLVELAYKLIDRRVRVRVVGRDIGAGLVAILRKLDADTIDELKAELSRYVADETDRLQRRYPDNHEGKVDALRDRVKCIRTIARDCSTAAEVEHAIVELFRDRDDGSVTLSSVHRAKGMEAPRVFVLDPWRMPHPMARTADAQQQEINLQYVAHSRAKDELVLLVPDPADRDEAMAKREAAKKARATWAA